MTKLHHVKRARKANRKVGIKKGQGYFWWKFSRCPKQYSLTKPPRSAYMTRSEFMAKMMDCEDECSTLDPSDPDAVKERLSEMADELRELADDQAEKASAVRERFPGGCPTFDLLDSRAEYASQASRDLQAAADRIEPLDASEANVAGILADISWEYE